MGHEAQGDMAQDGSVQGIGSSRVLNEWRFGVCRWMGVKVEGKRGAKGVGTHGVCQSRLSTWGASARAAISETACACGAFVAGSS